MRILLLIVLICNILSLILALVYYHLNNKIIKEDKRRLKLIYQICEDNIYEDIDELQMMYILADISSICNKGVRIFK